MDREVLKHQLRGHFEAALEQMIQAVEQAPDGRWIAASEWQVRQAGQELTQQCYQAIVQARLDVAQPPAAAFSPDGLSRALQGPAPDRRAQRRR